MKVIISHYEVQFLKVTEEIHSTKQQLSDLTTSNRFTFLLKSLESFIKKTSKGINFINLESSSDFRNKNYNQHNLLEEDLKILPHGFQNFPLTGTEKQAILNDDYICDGIIDAAMTLLHQQKPFFMFQSSQHSIINFYNSTHLKPSMYTMTEKVIL